MSEYKFIGEEGAKAILSRIKNLENSWTSAGGGATSTVRNTASGEAIVLTDSAERKLEGLKVYGKSEQKTTTGANLLDLTGSVPPSIVSNGITITIPEDGSYTFRGTATGSAINVWFLGGYSTELPTLFTLPAGTYYISGVLIFTGQSCLNSSLSVENPSGIFTIQSDFNVTGVRALKAVEGKEYDTVIYPIIAKSDTAIPWEPYTGCVATPNPKYTQKISSIGESIRENLFDPENVLDGYYFTGQDSVLRRSDGLATVYCKCDPNTTYTVSKISGVRFVVAYTTDEPANGAAIYGNIQKYHNKSITITTGSDAKYLVAYVHHSAQDPVSRERMLASIKIEEGPDATPYVPYNSEELGGKVAVTVHGESMENIPYAEQKLAIATPNGLPGIKVTDATLATYTDADGNMWCADEVDLGRGVYVERLIEIELTGNEEWVKTQDNEYRTNSFDKFLPKVKFEEAICTHYKNAEVNDRKTNGTFIRGIDGMQIFVIDTRFNNDVDAFKAYLAEEKANGNPVTIICRRITPIETPLSAEEIAAYQALHTNYPTTTLLNDSGAHMEVTYGADTKNYIDNKFKELSTALIALGGI